MAKFSHKVDGKCCIKVKISAPYRYYNKNKVLTLNVGAIYSMVFHEVCESG